MLDSHKNHLRNGIILINSAHSLIDEVRTQYINDKINMRYSGEPSMEMPNQQLVDLGLIVETLNKVTDNLIESINEMQKLLETQTTGTATTKKYLQIKRIYNAQEI